jgi:hypothetical protein
LKVLGGKSRPLQLPSWAKSAFPLPCFPATSGPGGDQCQSIDFSLLLIGRELFSSLETEVQRAFYIALMWKLYEENHIVDQNCGGKLNIQPVVVLQYLKKCFSHGKRTEKKNMLFVLLKSAPPPPPVLANIGKTVACQSQRKGLR